MTEQILNKDWRKVAGECELMVFDGNTMRTIKLDAFVNQKTRECKFFSLYKIKYSKICRNKLVKV